MAPTPSSVRCAIYLRVSTRDQRYLQQFREIRAAVQARGWTIARIYREKRSGAAGTDRPAWRKLRRDAQLRRFGAVAAWSLDRLGRSVLDILRAVEAFDRRGTRLYIVKDGIEISGTTGRQIVTVLAGVAQLERDVISERTKLGMEAARRRGAPIARTTADVARAHGVSPMTIQLAGRGYAGYVPSVISGRIFAV